MITTFRTTVHGRTIELPWELGLPESRIIEVTIKTCPEVESPAEPPLPRWLERLELNPDVAVGRFVIKGTRLCADALVALVEEGKADDEIIRAHPELTPEDVAAVRAYAKVPEGLRRSFGGWADQAEEVDKFLEEIRRARKVPRRGMAE
jgi:uncharacterized protein (DUF433 family)